jgi:hypothetical protein
MENAQNLKDAMCYLVETGFDLQAAKKAPTVLDIGDRKFLFFNGKFEEIERQDANAPDSISIYTLSGLVDWIHADPDHLFADKANPCTVKVEDPCSVSVLSQLTPIRRVRTQISKCRYEAPRVRYDTYMDAEDFGIMLQTNFIEDDNRNVVLKIARNLTEEQSAQTADDGVSQRVTLKAGVKEIDSAVFKNPAYLSPLRTFPEIAQPSSPFVIRFKEGHLAAIYESDGGAWRNEAVKRIGTWLKERLADTSLVVIA